MSTSGRSTGRYPLVLQLRCILPEEGCRLHPGTSSQRQSELRRSSEVLYLYGIQVHLLFSYFIKSFVEGGCNALRKPQRQERQGSSLFFPSCFHLCFPSKIIHVVDAIMYHVPNNHYSINNIKFFFKGEPLCYDTVNVFQLWLIFHASRDKLLERSIGSLIAEPHGVRYAVERADFLLITKPFRLSDTMSCRARPYVKRGFFFIQHGMVIFGAVNRHDELRP